MSRTRLVVVAIMISSAVFSVGTGGVAASAPASSTSSAPSDAPSESVRGTLVRTVMDSAEGGEPERVEAHVRTATGALPVADAIAVGVPSGAEVRADLTERGLVSDLAVLTAASVTTSASPLEGTHHVFFYPFYTADEVPDDAPSPAEIATAVANLDRYYSTVSGGRIRFVLDIVAPWKQVPPDESGACPFWDMEGAVFEASSSTPDTRFTHLVAYMADNSCGISGAAFFATPAQPGRRFLALSNTLHLSMFAHETGHTFGAMHTNALECFADPKKTQPVTLSDVCDFREYWDPWDVMGGSAWMSWDRQLEHAGHPSALLMRRFGLLDPRDHQLVASSRTVKIAALESGKGVRLITIPTAKRLYTLEYRTPTGPDSWITAVECTDNSGDTPVKYSCPGGGVVVRVLDPSSRSPDSEYVLDMHPQRDGANRGMSSGQRWTTPQGDLSINVDALTTDEATVTITRSDTTPPSADLSMGHDAYSIGGSEISGTGSVTVYWHEAKDADTGLEWVMVQLDGATAFVVRNDDLLSPPSTSGGYGVAAGSTVLKGLAEGPHTIRLVARDWAGNLRATITTRFVVSTTAPFITKPPHAELRTGPVTGSDLPVRVRWTARSACLLKSATVTRTPTGSTLRVSGAAQSAKLHAVVGEQNQFRVRTDDCRGTRKASGPVITPRLNTQNKRKGYSTGWTTVKGGLGGTEQVTSKKGAKVTYTTTARSIGWVTAKGPSRGKAAVYVDGRKRATIDLLNGHLSPNHQVFTVSFDKPGKHTIKIVNLATRDRETIGVDAFTRIP